MLPGFVHLYVGEEAVAVGVCSDLETRDLVFSTHRGHGHALAKGVPAGVVLAELWGKSPEAPEDAAEACTCTHLNMDSWAPTELWARRSLFATGGALSAKTTQEGPGRG